jgi:hypothetical protein
LLCAGTLLRCVERPGHHSHCTSGGGPDHPVCAAQGGDLAAGKPALLLPNLLGLLCALLCANSQHCKVASHVSLQKHVNFGKVSNVMILLLVFHSFSNTFDNKVSSSSFLQQTWRT